MTLSSKTIFCGVVLVRINVKMVVFRLLYTSGSCRTTRAPRRRHTWSKKPRAPAMAHIQDREPGYTPTAVRRSCTLGTGFVIANLLLGACHVSQAPGSDCVALPPRPAAEHLPHLPLAYSDSALLKPYKGFLHNTKDVLRILKDFEHT